MSQIDSVAGSTTTRSPGRPNIEAFDFQVCKGTDPLPWTGVASLCNPAGVQRPAPSITSAPSEPRSAIQQETQEQKMLQRFHEGKQEGFEQGRQAEREAQLGHIQAEHTEHKRQLANLIEQFERARNQYLQDVEKEVVELALAVSARIVRREAKLDPLLLTGAVRVALGQISNATVARLVVPKIDEELWKEAIEHLPQLSIRPEVIADPALCTGDCRIETEIGSVDLGVESQLSEIERGFFDREPFENPTHLAAISLEAQR